MEKLKDLMKEYQINPDETTIAFVLGYQAGIKPDS